MRSIFGRIADLSGTSKRCKILRPSGWKQRRQVKKITGYHKQMPKADLRALALRLQREAR